MFSKKSLLAISIGLAVQSASFAVEIGDYNYRGGAGDEQFNKDYNLYPIPQTDMSANSNLKQNKGY